MATEIDISVKGDKELELKLGDLKNAIKKSSRLMGRIGAFLSFKIKQRTNMGIDADLSPFLPYSKYYAKYREKHGRSINKVNLFYTGSMFSSMTYEQQNGKVDLFFMNTTDKFGVRNPLKAYWNQQSRRFFAISAQDIVQIEKMVTDYMNKYL